MWSAADGCYKVTVTVISLLVHGCGQLQSIDLSYCYEVTDAGMLVFGCACNVIGRKQILPTATK